MKLPTLASKKWGIIGDGQLARMLALAAYPLGIRPVVLTSDPNSPAGQVCPLVVRGSIHSKTDLHLLLSQVDHAVIESEFVNCDLLEATGLGHKVMPGLHAIRILQNKLEQKKLLTRLSISTSPLYEQTEITSLWLDRILDDSHHAIVLKYATFGYDGKGVCVLGHEPGDRRRAEAFCALAADRKIEVYAENRVDYLHEVAMVAVRNADGQFASYPLVLSQQKNGICNRVNGPATSFGIDEHLEATARKWCERVAKELDLIGVFAIEFFVTKGGSLLVNEIAPRVHNSGHFTQNASASSQFENHWLSVAGLPLGSTKSANFFAMQNLLGPSQCLSKDSALVPIAASGVHCHWYGKAGISPGRKLGHLNTYANNLAEHHLCLAAMDKTAQAWENQTRERIPPTSLELPG